MKTCTNAALVHHLFERMGLAVTKLMTSMGIVAAQVRHPSGSDQFSRPYPDPTCTSLDDYDRKAFDKSGTRDSMGLAPMLPIPNVQATYQTRCADRL